jgi:hypothetical protein
MTMSYVPGFEHDVFISYASENNRDGWVTSMVRVLAEELGRELERLLGRQFSRESVFFDTTELRPGQKFPEALQKAAEGSAMLVPVLSPSYLSSDRCDQERRAFLAKLPEGVGAGECLAPILVRPVSPTSLAELLGDAKITVFFEPGQQEPWPVGSEEWTAQVRKLATEVMFALQHLRQRYKPVFLGRVPSGYDELRARCASELQKRYFRVEPEGVHVLNDEALRESMRHAALSVHFIGGADPSALRAIEIAAEVCAGATILYRPFSADLTAEERLWLAAFEGSPLLRASGKYQRIEGKDEHELIAVLEQEITRIRPPAPAPAEPAALTVICDQPDLDLARRLRSEIQERAGLRVAYPAFLDKRDTAMERMRSWKKLVNACRTMLVCWSKTQDPTLLENVCHLAVTVSPDALVKWYLTQPELAQKRKRHPDAICQEDQFEYDSLTSFLEIVRTRSAAT